MQESVLCGHTALCPQSFGDILEDNTRGFQSLCPAPKKISVPWEESKRITIGLFIQHL